jgi:hypothetical protein
VQGPSARPWLFYLKNVVSHHAAKAGCNATWVREDSTGELLLHQFTPQQGSTMFLLKTPAAWPKGHDRRSKTSERLPRSPPPARRPGS